MMTLKTCGLRGPRGCLHCIIIFPCVLDSVRCSLIRTKFDAWTLAWGERIGDELGQDERLEALILLAVNEFTFDSVLQCSVPELTTVGFTQATAEFLIRTVCDIADGNVNPRTEFVSLHDKARVKLLSGEFTYDRRTRALRFVSHAPSADATQHPPPCRLDPPAVSQSTTPSTGAGGHVQSQSSQQQPRAPALTTVAPVAPSASAETTQHPPQSPLASPTDQTAYSQSTADTGAGFHVHSQSSQPQQPQAALTTPAPVAGDLLRGTKRKSEEAAKTKLFGVEIGTSEFRHFPSNVRSTCATRPRYWPEHWDSLAHPVCTPAGLTAARRMLSADNVEEAKSSYRRMALAMHPDKNLDDPEGACKAFGALKAAYEIINKYEEIINKYEALNEDNEDNEEVIVLSSDSD
jgi:hypothetical protein